MRRFTSKEQRERKKALTKLRRIIHLTASDRRASTSTLSTRWPMFMICNCCLVSECHPSCCCLSVYHLEVHITEHLSPRESVWVCVVSVAEWPVFGDPPTAERLKTSSSPGSTRGSAGVLLIQPQRCIGRHACARAMYDCCAWVNKLSVCMSVCVHVCLNAHVCVWTVYVRESQGAVKRRRAGNAPRHRKQANSISHYGELQKH